MKKNYFSRVIKVINSADIIIEVLDSRFPDLSRNKKIEKIVKQKRKQLLIVLNKSDLADETNLKKIKQKLSHPTVFLSAKQKNGIIKLRKELGKMSRKKNVIIGLIGYPNTGKSSIINALKGKASASVSSVAGHTKGEQFIRISEKILLIDTPGVLGGEKEEHLLVLMGAKNPEKMEDAELAAHYLIKYLFSVNQNFFNKKFEITDKNPEIVLKKIALKKKKLLKGGKPDTKTTAFILLRDWQKGKIN